MDFDVKTFNIVLVIFQMKIIFQQFFFQHINAHLNEKLVKIFFIKPHESKFSIVIEMVQSTHIQYIFKYFIKFCNYLFILKVYLHFAIYCYMFYFLTYISKKCSFFWQLHYLVTELLYFEYNLWKPLLILVWWKLQVAQFWK
jgi:hypothetical protein